MKKDSEIALDTSIKLRREISAALGKFWENNKNMSKEDMFFINSVVCSSLISQIVYTMFKKDLGNLEKQNEYIDQICEFTKEQLKLGTIMTLLSTETDQ